MRGMSALLQFAQDQFERRNLARRPPRRRRWPRRRPAAPCACRAATPPSRGNRRRSCGRPCNRRRRRWAPRSCAWARASGLASPTVVPSRTRPCRSTAPPRAKNAFEQRRLAALERADDRDQSRPGDASVAVLGLAHGSRSFGWFGPYRLADCRKYFTRRGKCQCFWRDGQASGLNPSRTKPIDRDQRRFPGATSARFFCRLEFSTPETGKK